MGCTAARPSGGDRRFFGQQRVFDAASDLVDRLRVGVDRVQGAVLAPAGDVGDRLAAGVEAEVAADDVGDAVDHDLGPCPVAVGVADAQGVRDLVHEHPHARVGRQGGVDDDAPGVRVAPPIGGPVERAVLDLEAELARELGERGEQVGVAVAGDRLGGRLERDGLAAGQGLGLRDVLSRDSTGTERTVARQRLGRVLSGVPGRFEVRREDGVGAGLVVVGPGRGAIDASDFLAWLSSRGRGSYTARSYAFGLAHFLAWLDERELVLGDVDRSVLAGYISAFRDGDAGCPLGRRPRTVNHRLSVLASFFAFLLARDAERDGGAAVGRPSPVPGEPSVMLGGHGMPGRDRVRRGRRSELRQRVARTLPRRVEPEVAVALIAAAVSWRDKALLTLLWRTGQRIGDRSEIHGRHGLLGMRLADLDRRAGMITVRLKGARDEHRVPVSEDFWPLFARYVADERGFGEPEEPAWMGLRKGSGTPLGYAAFESSLRYTSGKVGVRVTAHMFRHALAQALVDTAGVHVAQEVLGHAHISTTVGTYARVDERAMVDALARANGLFDLAAAAAATAPDAAQDEDHAAGGDDDDGYVFDYAAGTLAELDAISSPTPPAAA